MSDHLQQLRDLAGSYTEDGETIVDVVKVIYGGKVNLSQPPTGLAALGVQDTVVAGERLASRDEAPTVEFPTANQMALVLTGRRLLVWSTGGLKGKPKSFLGEVPLAAIESFEFEEARLNSRYVIRLTSGWEVNLEATKGEPGAEFGAHLQHLIA